MLARALELIGQSSQAKMPNSTAAASLAPRPVLSNISGNASLLPRTHHQVKLEHRQPPTLRLFCEVPDELIGCIQGSIGTGQEVIGRRPKRPAAEALNEKRNKSLINIFVLV